MNLFLRLLQSRIPLIIILTIHSLMLAWNGYRHSPTWDEVGHLPAGLAVWKQFNFSIYSVNPPLVRSVAAIPVLLVSHEEDWHSFTTKPGNRCEFDIGRDFIKANGVRSFWLFTMARWACIPFSLLAAYICFRWANELYGRMSL